MDMSLNAILYLSSEPRDTVERRKGEHFGPHEREVNIDDSHKEAIQCSASPLANDCWSCNF